jgi:hypothetical protein
MLRLILFVLLAYLVWRVLESVLKLTGREDTRKNSVREAPRAPRQSPKPPFRDIRDAEFEDLTPKKDDPEKPPVSGT